MSLEELYKLYIKSNDTKFKDKLVYDILIKLDSYINLIAKNYYYKCACHAIEDWKQIITIGVLSGIRNTKDNASMKSSIMYHIQKEGGAAIQYATADKRNYKNEIIESDISYYTNCANFDIYSNSYYEEDWILNIDLKDSITKLPSNYQNILLYILDGKTWKEICDILNITKSTFYNYKNKAFKLLRENLKGYNCGI